MIIEAILKINPNAVVSVTGENIDDCEIKWLENTTAISKSKIKSKINELKAGDVAAAAKGKPRRGRKPKSKK